MTRLHVTIATADERVEESGNKMKEDENKIRDDALTEFRKDILRTECMWGI
jgi:hypothetical protein